MLERIAFLLPIDSLIHLLTFSLVLLLFDKTSLAIVPDIAADGLRPWSNSLKVKSENGWQAWFMAIGPEARHKEYVDGR